MKTGLLSHKGTHGRIARIWNAARRNPAASVGSLIVLLAVLVAIFAPLIAPFGADQTLGPPFAGPSATHLLGLDDVGADTVSLLIWGARVSLLVAFVAGLGAVAIGGLIGVVAGYRGGWIDSVLLAITDYFLVIPVLPLAILIAALWGPKLTNEIVIIALLSWMPTARIIRAQVLTLRERTYILRTRSMGASGGRTLLQHMVPAVAPLLIASTVLSVGNAIFFEAALSFLGLGDPRQVTWGKMIADGFNRGAVAAGAWWAIVPPGLVIGIVVLGSSLLGRALEDSTNPRLSTSHLGAKTFRMRHDIGR